MTEAAKRKQTMTMGDNWKDPELGQLFAEDAPIDGRDLGSFLVIGFIPDNEDIKRDGVHTPLRSDGYYGLMSGLALAKGVADLWARPASSTMLGSLFFLRALDNDTKHNRNDCGISCGRNLTRVLPRQDGSA